MIRLPSEILGRILQHIAQPEFGTHADDDPEAALNAARRSLRTTALVCSHWWAPAGALLEQRVHLPWTASQLESYTSRPRRRASEMMRIIISEDALGDEGGHRLVQSVQAVAGVTTLHFVSKKNAVSSGWLADVLGCASLDGMTELSISGGYGLHWDDPVWPTFTPYGFRLERLFIPLTNSSMHSTAPSTELLDLLFPVNNTTLQHLELVNEETPWNTARALPPLGVGHVLHLSFAPSPGRTTLSLSPFHSLTSLSLKWVPSKRHPDWKPTARVLNQLATLSPTATLARLSLPCGSTANLHLFAERLNVDVALSHLTELRLPNLARTVLESDEPGCAFAVACEARQIELLLSEDLVGVPD